MSRGAQDIEVSGDLRQIDLFCLLARQLIEATVQLFSVLAAPMPGQWPKRAPVRRSMFPRPRHPPPGAVEMALPEAEIPSAARVGAFRSRSDCSMTGRGHGMARLGSS